MPYCHTRLDAGILITQNSERDILYNASLAIAGGIVQAVGDTAKMRKEWQVDEVVDCSAMLVMPGLINAHTHAAMTFARGFADDLPLMKWLQNAIFPMEARLTPDVAYLGSLLGYAEMLATGTTACVDMYIYEENVLAAAEKAGLRCMGGEAVFGFPSAACPNYRDALERTAELAERYSGHPRISVAVNPHSVYTTSPAILRECREIAHRMNLPVHIHLAETAAETAQCLKTHGVRPVELAERLGLLDTRLIAAHLVDITGEEARMLAAADACGVHNPASNMKLASGAAPVAEMQAQGLKLGLGTDGPASNNQLNMFSEMRSAALLQKLVRQDSSCMPAGAVLDMATRGGAEVMGDPKLGKLQAGSAADCIALDVKAPNMQPLHNPVSQVVYAATGHECRMTMVDGEILWQNGMFARFDYSEVLKEIEKLVQFTRMK